MAKRNVYNILQSIRLEYTTNNFTIIFVLHTTSILFSIIHRTYIDCYYILNEIDSLSVLFKYLVSFIT